jgi:hypothetical protein
MDIDQTKIKNKKKLCQTCPTTLTVSQLLVLLKEYFGSGRFRNDNCYWPFGNHDTPRTKSQAKRRFFSSPNMIIAWYIHVIESRSPILQYDSRILQTAGPCLQLSTNAKKIEINVSKKLRITVSTLSGFVHSVINKYHANIPLDTNWVDRVGCHLCLEPKCVRHVMIAGQNVNLNNDKCQGNQFCQCSRLGKNYGNCPCLFIARNIN